jgi:PucR C-terminal helix-turn-helix domain/GGDEF-like domain
MSVSRGEIRAGLHARLSARRPEIEQAIIARINVVSGPGPAGGEEFDEGRLRAVSAGVGHGLDGIERGADPTAPIPAALFAQARRAARNGITPDVALRRYFAGYTVFNDFVVEAAEEGISLAPVLGSVLRSQAVRFERLVVAAMGEYTRERGQPIPPERRQTDQVKRLLAGEPVDPGELAYELDDWHIGAVARGDSAAALLRGVAQAADRRLLLVCPDDETVWAWFAGRHRVGVEEITRRVLAGSRAGVLLALGEPARGVEGWRLSHRQASAAMRVARRGAQAVVRYADVGLLASISQDAVLASSLRQLYLAPLSGGRDGGATLKQTLGAYFTAGRNISSAASALGVSRQTVGSRLRMIEEKLGRTLESCGPEVEVALRLEGSGDPIDPGQS